MIKIVRLAEHKLCLGCLLYLILSLPLAEAQVSMQSGSSGSCNVLVMSLLRHWQEIKNHLLPTAQELKEPSSDSFVCVSLFDRVNAREKRISSAGNFRFYDVPFNNGFGICCDIRGYECAQLDPTLFPEIFPNRRKEEGHQAPKSNWVKPPSESDQWSPN